MTDSEFILTKMTLTIATLGRMWPSEGLISNTMRNNPYMRLAIDKWEQQGAKQRVLRLVAEYKKAVSTRLKQPILTE